MNDQTEQTDKGSTILCVDDEKNILLSLKRLFRTSNYKVILANSGAEGLALLEENQVDLVISDMRMPAMTGAEFLEKVAIKWPDIVRILLTGFSDVTSTVDAINKGKIYQYISKPWDDAELKLTVSQALENANLKQERDRLQALALTQNEQLKDLNANLEKKVAQRTAALNDAMQELEQTNKELKNSYMASIRTFAGLIEMRKELGSGESRKVAELARKLAVACGLEENVAQNVMIAGLLHNIGKLSLNDNLLVKPYLSLTDSEKLMVNKHPIISESVLMGLEPLADPARYIRSHHEHYNGSGYPDGLDKNDIPFESCVLAVANDFEALKNGRIYSQKFSEEKAIEAIKKGSGGRYHPKVVASFLKLFGADQKEISYAPERVLRVSALKAGMILSQDLVASNNIPLLTKGKVLTERLIEKLENYERSLKENLSIHIRVNVG